MEHRELFFAFLLFKILFKILHYLRYYFVFWGVSMLHLYILNVFTTHVAQVKSLNTFYLLIGLLDLLFTFYTPPNFVLMFGLASTVT